MPLHDFRCRACSHEFEALVRPNQKEPTRCPACAAENPEQLLSTFAVSSAEKTRAAADKARKRAAAIGRQETMAADREIAEHLREDH